MISNMKVWWKPEATFTKRFEIPVSSIDEAKKVLSTLAEYDKFRFFNQGSGHFGCEGGLLVQNTEGQWSEWADPETGVTLSELVQFQGRDAIDVLREVLDSPVALVTKPPEVLLDISTTGKTRQERREAFLALMAKTEGIFTHRLADCIKTKPRRLANDMVRVPIDLPLQAVTSGHGLKNFPYDGQLEPVLVLIDMTGVKD